MGAKAARRPAISAASRRRDARTSVDEQFSRVMPADAGIQTARSDLSNLRRPAASVDSRFRRSDNIGPLMRALRLQTRTSQIYGGRWGPWTPDFAGVTSSARVNGLSCHARGSGHPDCRLGPLKFAAAVGRLWTPAFAGVTNSARGSGHPDCFRPLKFCSGQRAAEDPAFAGVTISHASAGRAPMRTARSRPPPRRAQSPSRDDSEPAQRCVRP